MYPGVKRTIELRQRSNFKKQSAGERSLSLSYVQRKSAVSDQNAVNFVCANLRERARAQDIARILRQNRPNERVQRVFRPRTKRPGAESLAQLAVDVLDRVRGWLSPISELVLLEHALLRWQAHARSPFVAVRHKTASFPQAQGELLAVAHRRPQHGWLREGMPAR